MPGACFITLFTNDERTLLYELHLDEESVKTEYGDSENKNRHNDKLHGVFAKIVIRLAVRKIATHNGTDEKGEE